MTEGRFLDGKQALVTGGSSGIGQAVAAALRRCGCQVLATALTAQQQQQFLRRHSEISCTVLDVTEADSVARCAAELSRLDVLVNCAGTILRDGQEHEPPGFERVIDVNLNGVMRVCAACRPLLFAAEGCVVNIASMLTFFGSGPAPAYSASKGGVGQLTKSLAIAWAEQGVRVNAVAPGWIETELTRPLTDDPQRRQQIIDRTPLGRWGVVEDVVGAVLFLCSPEASFITGAVLPVDGGYSVA